MAELSQKSDFSKKRVVVFGAGQIGRGFIGEICSNSGYPLVFVDVNENLVRILNKEKEYPLWLLDRDSKIEKKISGLSALSFGEREKIAEVLSTVDLAFTAVGVNNLEALAPILAEGIREKADRDPKSFLNIVICENLLGSSEVLRKATEKYLEGKYLDFFRERIGLIETVVSRMVSPLTDELRLKYPLLVTVEKYNILPVDKKSFKGAIPQVKGFYPVDNLFPYEELKLFVHNLSHACLAYAGYIKGYVYIWEALEDKDIRQVFDGLLEETKQSLIKKHNFNVKEIEDYTADLICRFGNKSLNDTVYRVGRDPLRKLGSQDRLSGSIKLCLSQGIYPQNICFVTACCLCYNYKTDEKALELQNIIRKKGVFYVLEEISDLEDGNAKETILQYYGMLIGKNSILHGKN